MPTVLPCAEGRRAYVLCVPPAAPVQGNRSQGLWRTSGHFIVGLNRRAIAKLVGLAPLNCDSDHQKSRRAIWDGRAWMRSFLYMAALVATRYNPAVKALYERLIEKDKPAKLALAASMRKLLTIVNAMLRDHSNWTQQLA